MNSLFFLNSVLFLKYFIEISARHDTQTFLLFQHFTNKEYIQQESVGCL